MTDEQLPVTAPIATPSEEEFGTFQKDFVSSNEVISNRYERIAKDLQDALENKFPADLEKLEDALKTRYDETRLKISMLRKSGKDMLIPSLMLRPFQAKLAMAHASRDHSDYEHVKLLLDQVAFEIKEAENAREPDVKGDVMRLVDGANAGK